MRQEMKICFPIYKLVYSLCFMVILSLIRGIIYTDEIGIAIDTNAALLAIVFCAETYVMERSGKREEVFALFPMKKKSMAVRRRFVLQAVYLCLISYIGYFFFYWQKPVNRGNSPVYLYGIYLIAITATCIFWGALSMTVSNIFRSQWTGIGISLVLWLLINSTAGQRILGKFSIFAFCFREMDAENMEWLWGKAAGILLAVVMIGFIPYILKKRG